MLRTIEIPGNGSNVKGLRADQATDPKADPSCPSGLSSRLKQLIGETAAALEGEDFARAQVDELVRTRAERATREAKAAPRHQRRVLARRDEVAPLSALPQTAKPPAHMHKGWQVAREADAERKAVASALKAGRRDVVYLPAWCRVMARQIAVDKAAATRELGHVPRAVADSLRASARPYGGLDGCAGRNVVALGVVFYWLAKRLRGRLSGLPSEAWASLTVGSYRQHYGSSMLFHAYHRAEAAELSPDLRGPYGGRVGIGANRGLVRAIEAEGWLRVIVPDAETAPGWMVAPSGWSYVQLLVTEPESSDDTS